MKTLIIHHNDRDGIVSAAIMIQYVKKLRDEICDGIHTEEVDYAIPLSDKIKNVDSYDRIIMVDYSISTKDNAEWVLRLKNKDKDIIWIDHHVSSFKIISKYPELDELKGLRVVGIAGCGLCWLYSKGVTELQPNIDKNDAVAILKQYNAPSVVVFSHRYDIWDTSKTVIDFSRGFNPSSCTDTELYTALQYPKYGKIITDKAINNGSVITNYLNSKNERVASQIGFELDIIDDREEVPVIYKAFAMNDVFSSSLNFGDRINTYDIVIPFYFNGDKYVYSMYSAKDDVNVEPLCTALGGGGHKHAAGFTSKTLDISRGGALIIKNKE